MATANEIEQYGGDKNLAFGSNALPAASTDAIIDSSPAIKYWSDYANNKLLVAREQDAQLKKKQLKVQEDFFNTLDPSKYKFWEKDQAYATKAWEDFRKAAVDVMKKGNWENINDPDYLKVKKMGDDLLMDAQFSTQQQINYNVGDDAYTKNPFNYADGSRESLDSYANAKSPKERASMGYNLTPNISLDFPAYVAKLKTSITPTQKLTTEMVNGRYVDTTETLYDADKIDAATKVDYQTNKKFKAEADEAFGELIKSDPQAAQTFGTPQRYASATAWDMLNGGSKVIAKNPFFAPADVRNPMTVQYQEGIPENVTTAKEELKVFKITNPDNTVVYKVKNPDGSDAALVNSDGNPIKNSFNTEDKAQAARKISGGVKVMHDIGGWYYSGVADFPSNININAPQSGYDYKSNIQLTPKETGTEAWHVDVVSVTDKYKNKQTGKIADRDDPDVANNPNNYQITRVAKVKRDNGSTYDIPYTDNIKTSLENAVRKAKVNVEIPDVGVTQGNQQAKAQGTQQFVVKGVTYNIPNDKVDAFKKAKGLSGATQTGKYSETTTMNGMAQKSHSEQIKSIQEYYSNTDLSINYLPDGSLAVTFNEDEDGGGHKKGDVVKIIPK